MSTALDARRGGQPLCRRERTARGCAPLGELKEGFVKALSLEEEGGREADGKGVPQRRLAEVGLIERDEREGEALAKRRELKLQETPVCMRTCGRACVPVCMALVAGSTCLHASGAVDACMQAE